LTNKLPEVRTPPRSSAPEVPPPYRVRWRAFIAASAALVLAFGLPLYQLARFAMASELYSYTVIVPVISLYLVWLKRKKLPTASPPDRRIAALLLGAGGVVLAAYWLVGRSGPALTVEDALSFSMLAFVLLFVGLCALFLGRALLRALTFPLAFLVCMVPLPLAASDGIEIFLQHRSASAAAWFFKLYGTPFFRVETYFQLPGFSLNVAPECSGIHSSLALFITSLVASYLFLRSPWRRTLLCLAVLPLAILRNGLRVFIIGELCVHVGPEMIDSYIHRHGGPIFFVLSLVPFFLLLLLLIRSERRRSQPSPSTPESS
jgi:exosortase C (VPDSG-CTERM-specific)